MLNKQNTGQDTIATKYYKILLSLNNKMNNDQFETYLKEEYKIKLDELLDQNDNHLNELLNQI